MKLLVLPQTLAEAYSKDKTVDKTLIISIRCPGEDRPDFGKTIKEGDKQSKIYDIFEMQFNDLSEDVDNLKAPIQENFNGLKEFIDTNKDNIDTILVHCAAGYSRSPGCALAISEYLDLEDPYVEKNGYSPNLLVYSLAKKELGIAKSVEYYEDMFIDTLH